MIDKDVFITDEYFNKQTHDSLQYCRDFFKENFSRDYSLNLGTQAPERHKTAHA